MTTVFVDTPPPPPANIDLEYLHKNALWMIMDAWYPHPWPHDVKEDPEIDQRSDVMANRIADYLPNLKHVKNSCPDRFPIHPKLAHIENYANEASGDIRVREYMQENQLKDIVYIGFHLGRCILHKETGAINMQRFNYRLWMKDDLVGRLITDNEGAMLDKSRKWLNIIGQKCG